MKAKLPPCPVALRARGATWECELEEVFRLRADALPSQLVTLGPTNIRGPSGTVNTGNRPNRQLLKTRVTAWLVEL